MKIIYTFIFVIFIAAQSCSMKVSAKIGPKANPTAVKTNPNGKVPPGQAKKASGDQSAKSHAPGQQKKLAGDQSAKSHAPGQQKKK